MCFLLFAGFSTAFSAEYRYRYSCYTIKSGILQWRLLFLSPPTHLGLCRIFRQFSSFVEKSVISLFLLIVVSLLPFYNRKRNENALYGRPELENEVKIK